MVMPNYYKNKKTGNIYRYDGMVTNATNAQNEQCMVKYYDEISRETYVREISEFNEKFESITQDEVYAWRLARKVD
jgi:hypothetical protein